MSYQENRVRVSEFGRLSADSPLLVPIPTEPGGKQQFLHALPAADLARMSAACERDIGIRLLVSGGRRGGGHRKHLWPSREAYEAELIRRYQGVLVTKLKRPVKRPEVIAYGRKYLGYESPHETGLCIDLKCGGLEPVSATIAKQVKTKVFLWLKEHAWKYGFTPYLPEPWHLERRLSLDEYHTGRRASEEAHVTPVLGTPIACFDEFACCEAEDLGK
jgi:hypothetical protein